MKQVYVWVGIILLSGIFLNPLPSLGLECYKCNMNNNSQCLDNYPRNKSDKDEPDMPVQCKSYDVGCIIYQYYDNSTNKRKGGKRCLCKTEMDCLENQDVQLNAEELKSFNVSFKDYLNCMDNYHRLPGEKKSRRRRRRRDADDSTPAPAPAPANTGGTDELTNMTVYFCEEDGCNKHVPTSGVIILSTGACLNLMITLFVTFFIFQFSCA